MVLLGICEGAERYCPAWMDEVRARVVEGYRYFYEDVAGKNDVFVGTLYLQIWGAMVFWGIGGMFALLDFTAPARLERYKVQDKVKNFPMESSLFAKVARRVLFNQVVVGAAMSALAWPFMKRFGMTYAPSDVPSAKTFVWHLLAFALVEDVLFYSTHRMAHEVTWLYKNVHKIHHELVQSFSIGARYAHPLEDFFSNLLPVVAGPILCGSHMLEVYLWVSVALTITLIGHSGYHLPLLPSSEAHDYHHLKFTGGNYGAIGLLDDLFSTNSKFKKSVQAKRDIVLPLGGPSARQLFPMPPTKSS
eukprot:CAMPEP_0119122440 /NCGR_PEP_ID=MMETSP1310-20130426/2698_1 /TAXON_ID=464262 /ORGANISM="Genus nov. species nov., Strain RCC2339" /LENGTH=303 /DNA_ID=CAMNT_0007112095 /DNA_START=61 /DNA_END=972 /DNA_ORIENTATION=-